MKPIVLLAVFLFAASSNAVVYECVSDGQSISSDHDTYLVVMGGDSTLLFKKDKLNPSANWYQHLSGETISSYPIHGGAIRVHHVPDKVPVDWDRQSRCWAITGTIFEFEIATSADEVSQIYCQPNLVYKPDTPCNAPEFAKRPTQVNCTLL